MATMQTIAPGQTVLLMELERNKRVRKWASVALKLAFTGLSIGIQFLPV
jgi:hypothetical protein